jgi:hypothetical protein
MPCLLPLHRPPPTGTLVPVSAAIGYVPRCLRYASCQSIVPLLPRACCPAPVPPVQLAWPAEQGAMAQPWVTHRVLTETPAMPHSVSSPCLADAVVSPGRQSPLSFNATPGPSSPSIPGFTLSCAAQPLGRANPGCLYFMQRSTPPPCTACPGVVRAFESELAATLGLALRVLPPLSRCLGLGGG